VPFDDASSVAYPRSAARSSRVEWRHALAQTRGAWERSYNGQAPTPGEAATVFLAELWREPVEPEPVGEVVASRCG
jgi:hypothetical protein